MGVGAGWFEQEHAAYGIHFGTAAERIHRLDEAAEIIKRLWAEKQVTFEGKYYQLKDAYCEPKPLQQPRPPIMIGGAGEKLTLRVVAKHADQWNTFGPPALFSHKLKVLGEHCAAVGRNIDEIEISWAGAAAVTDSKATREALVNGMAKAFGRPAEEIEPGLLVGSAGEVRERIERFIEAGVTHFIMIANTPFNHDSIRRFAEEVMPTFKA